MMNMVFKPIGEIEIKEMRIGVTPMEDIIAESKTVVKIPRTRTFTAELTYANNELLYRMAYARINEGLEYPYDLFDLADDPSIIDKITNL